MLAPGGQQLERLRRQSGVVDIKGWLATRGALISFGEDVGCGEYINHMHGMLLEMKSGKALFNPDFSHGKGRKWCSNFPPWLLIVDTAPFSRFSANFLYSTLIIYQEKDT
jgi:hypothetical protein